MDENRVATQRLSENGALRFEWHDGLQGLHDGRRRGDGIDAQLRHGAVGAAAQHLELEKVRRREDGARPAAQGSAGKIWPQMQTKDLAGTTPEGKK